MSFIQITVFAVLYAVVAFGLPVHEAGDHVHRETWVAEPKGRGTLGILTSCGVTLGLCVWSAIHPDVTANSTPGQRLYDRIVWMLMALCTPEAVITIAFQQWKDSRHLHNAIRFHMQEVENEIALAMVLKKTESSDNSNSAPRNGEKSESHTTMPAILPHSPDDKIDIVAVEENNEPKHSGTPIATEIDTIESETTDQLDDFGKAGAFFVIMGGFVTPNGDTISPLDFYNAIKTERANLHKQVNRRDILDKGKASILAKLVVSVQVSWLVIQLVSRKLSGLPIALIELHVTIHILITAVVYILWWHKPLDASESIKLDITLHGVLGVKARQQATRQQGLLDYSDTFNLLRRLWPKKRSGAAATTKDVQLTQEQFKQKAAEELQRKFLRGPKPNSFAYNLPALIFYMMYASLHATAWNGEFPTLIERWVWRGSCLIVGIVPIGLGLLMLLVGKKSNGHQKGSSLVLEFIIAGLKHILKTVYLLGSAALLVESFITLRSLPSAAYETVPWADYLPHF